MKIASEPPFENYTCYKVFHREQGRWMVCLVPKGGGKRTTTSYGRFVVSVREGRILDKEEEADHIDGDRSNDSLDNLEIVTKIVNTERYYALHPEKRKSMFELVCPQCLGTFLRERRQLQSTKRSGARDFCSRKCVNASMRLLA